MIFDSINNLHRYVSEEDYQYIRAFLDQVNEDMPEGKYEICGERIFARVMSYQTKDSEICKIEAHNKYIDIQSTIYGAEGIDIYPRERMKISENYDADKDVAYFSCSGLPSVHVNNLPGFFSFILPEEAHSPQQRIGDIEYVKKFVIKVSYNHWVSLQ